MENKTQNETTVTETQNPNTPKEAPMEKTEKAGKAKAKKTTKKAGKAKATKAAAKKNGKAKAEKKVAKKANGEYTPRAGTAAELMFKGIKAGTKPETIVAQLAKAFPKTAAGKDPKVAMRHISWLRWTIAQRAAK